MFTTSITQEWKVTDVTATARPSNSQKKSQRSWTKKTEDDKDKDPAIDAKAALQQVVEQLVFRSENLQKVGKNRNNNNHPRAVAHDICVCRGSN
jgi:hypothetical protein